jgi:hypothetical protein
MNAEKIEDTKEAINRRITDNTMAKRKKYKQRSTKHYTERSSNNMNPNKYWG